MPAGWGTNLYRFPSEDGQHMSWGFHCPGCGYGHAFKVAAPAGWKGPIWSFNGDRDRPTFEPSLLVNGSDPARRCHLFLRDGQVQYLNDCHHELRGQTLPLSDPRFVLS